MTDYRLASSLNDLTAYLAEFDNELKVFGYDVETSGLDTRLAVMAGVSVSKKVGTAIYCPVGHNLGTNLAFVDVCDVIAQEQAVKSYEALCYNTKYDCNTTEENLGWGKGWYPNPVFDVLELVYLENPDRKQKGLKLVAKEDLNIDMLPFESLFSAEEIATKTMDIRTKHPKRCVDYACADADLTLQLYIQKLKVRQENQYACVIDTKLVEVIRKIEHEGGMALDVEYIERTQKALIARAAALREQLIRVAGKTFDPDSPKQLGIALFEWCGVPNQGVTRGKNPIYKTDEDTLDALSQAHPIVEIAISYKKVTKAKSSYLDKMKYLADSGKPVRFSFNQYAAPTFRLAAPGGDPDVDGFTGINIQAVSNGESRDLYTVDLTSSSVARELVHLDQSDVLVEGDQRKPEELMQGRPNLELPWVVEAEDGTPLCFRETCIGCPAKCANYGIDTTRRWTTQVKMIPPMRNAFKAPDGYTIVAFDYDRQELVIGANMSGEKSWLVPLKEHRDVHAETACTVYNLPSLDGMGKQEKKEKRADGKTFNFATFFGADEYTISKKLRIPIQTAKELYNNFKRSKPELFSWIAKVHAFARKSGYTTTWFGRKRPLKWLYDSPEWKTHSFADRSAVNTAVQGTGAEVTRIAMVRVNSFLKERKLTNKEVQMMMQIHDDLTFLIRDDLVEEMIPLLKARMEFHVKDWEVQLTVGAKVGKSWGSLEERKVA